MRVIVDMWTTTSSEQQSSSHSRFLPPNFVSGRLLVDFVSAISSRLRGPGQPGSSEHLEGITITMHLVQDILQDYQTLKELKGMMVEEQRVTLDVVNSCSCHSMSTDRS